MWAPPLQPRTQNVHRDDKQERYREQDQECGAPLKCESGDEEANNGRRLDEVSPAKDGPTNPLRLAHLTNELANVLSVRHGRKPAT